MVTTESHQNQDLMVPAESLQNQDLMVPAESLQNQDLTVPAELQDLILEMQESDPASPAAAFDPERFGQGPVNAITVLTLLDKLVNMLDAVQDNQSKMEMHQVQMQGVVRGIQAEMTRLSKNHSQTSNTVSKLLDKSRKLSVTMKEVRERMERQGAQVKKLEANHAHLISRNNFKVLIFQEENEIPSSVFTKEPPPFPRDEILEEGELPVPGGGDHGRQEGFQSIDLSSDEDVGLEADLGDDEPWPQELDAADRSAGDRLKRSSLKKMDSLKKAFSRQNFEKKMNKIGTKIVSAEQREKIKQRTSSLKVSHLTFGRRKSHSSPDSHPPDSSAPARESVSSEVDVQLSSPGSAEQELPFTEVHAQLAPPDPQLQAELDKEGEEPKPEVEEFEIVEVKEEVREGSMVVEADVEADVSAISEGLSEEYALSATLPQEGGANAEGEES